LAVLYLYQGRYQDAEPLFIKALELSKRLLGEEHPSVATSYNNLALLYKSQGRYQDAEPLYVKALEIAELNLGVDHPRTTTIRENLKSVNQKVFPKGRSLKYLYVLILLDTQFSNQHT